MSKSCDNCRYGYEVLCQKPQYNEVCKNFSHWKPKEAETVKTYTRKEMIIALMENPKRKAECVVDIFGVEVRLPIRDKVCVNNDGDLKWVSGSHCSIYVENDKSEWTITEPPVETVDFAEAFFHYYKPALSKVKSVVTGKEYKFAANYLSTATPEEVKGKWILL